LALRIRSVAGRECYRYQSRSRFWIGSCCTSRGCCCCCRCCWCWSFQL